MKYFKFLAFAFLLSFSITGMAQESTEPTPEKTEITEAEATVTNDTEKVSTEADNGNITDLINQIEDDSESFIEALKDPSFPPKNAAGWLAFVFATLIPFITKIVGDKAKYLSIFKNIKLEGNTNAIIIWISIGLAGIYEGIISQVDFSFTDWGGYSVLTYGFGMAIHEVFKSIQKNKKEE
jgi:hypothetical protein